MTENERLTHKRANGWGWTVQSGASPYWTPATKNQLMERLAAYEDTGLSPEEVAAMAADKARKTTARGGRKKGTA